MSDHSHDGAGAEGAAPDPDSRTESVADTVLATDWIRSPRFVLIANVWICLVIIGFIAFRVLGSNTFRALVAGLRQ